MINNSNSISDMEHISKKLKTYSLISLLNSYSRGILLPILSLLLLEKGLSFSNLAVVLGIYALTVVILELPTKARG